MSMVQELITAVSGAERQIDEQLGRLQVYLNEIDQVTRRIDQAMHGSTQDYERQMLQQLSATRNTVSRSIGTLQMTREKLRRVRMI